MALAGTDVVLPDDPRFPAAARPANAAAAPGPPLAVVEARTVAAVQQAVALLAPTGLPLAVHGGGWSVAALAGVEAGLVLSLRHLDGISVDPASGLVQVGAGVRAGQLEAAMAPHRLGLNLSAPSGPAVIGAALSGGVGHTMRKAGFGCDALVSARVVLADGSLVEADDERTPDLMWALRGGGGNFGVVVDATFQARPTEPLNVMQCFYDQAEVPAVLRFIRDWGPALPDDVTLVAMLRTLPELPRLPPRHRGQPGLLIAAVSCGSAQDSALSLAPLRELGGALHQQAPRLTPAALRAVTDQHFPHQTFGARARSGWLDRPDDGLLDALADAGGAVPPGHSMLELAVLGGAVAAALRPSAAPGREAAWFCNALALWTDVPDTSAEAARARDWLESPVFRSAQLTAHGVVPGFASADELDTAARTYGAALPRLQEVKRATDPDNLFRRNLNVTPPSVGAA